MVQEVQILQSPELKYTMYLYCLYIFSLLLCMELLSFETNTQYLRIG